MKEAPKHAKDASTKIEKIREIVQRFKRRGERKISIIRRCGKHAFVLRVSNKKVDALISIVDCKVDNGANSKLYKGDSMCETRCRRQ